MKTKYASIIVVLIFTLIACNKITAKAFAKDNNLTGTQLWSEDDKAFGKVYYTMSISKFILIEPVGNTVEAEASQPSDSKLKDLLESLTYNFLIVIIAYYYLKHCIDSLGKSV